MAIESMKGTVESWLSDLQDRICAALETHDGLGGTGLAGNRGARFRSDRWERAGGGGGHTRVLEGGQVFEKAGVNTSTVFGELDPAFASQLPGDGSTFYASGLSLVLHPVSPAVPTVHANFRFIVHGAAAWFGGGADLTPYLLFEDDCRHFHATWKAACDRHDPTYHPKFKAWCDRYFYSPHREEHRGIGGIFFDSLAADDSHDLMSRFAFVRTCGESFLDAYLPIAERRVGTATTDADRAWQLVRRGRYVEFNLVYDRGTTFGLKTKGRVESILMSLPPVVHFPYAPEPPDDRARALLDVLARPRDWV